MSVEPVPRLCVPFVYDDAHAAASVGANNWPIPASPRTILLVSCLTNQQRIPVRYRRHRLPEATLMK
ncbi:MAG: hypothetical protein RMI91_09640 [Gemmatales bacterium]|nr:hypothetical protein [Gemmatales bacterium]MDW7994902.1 hypothetical protein [Gemmatales bacterium]